MQMKRYNKATAAVLGGAAVSVLSAFFVMDETLQEALRVVIVAGLVWLVPNVED